MWFLRGKPNAITVRALIISAECGYQHTSYRFKVDADSEGTKDGKMWVAIAFPWSPHKENGGISSFDSNLLTLLEDDQEEDVHQLTLDDAKLYDNLRKIKKSQDIDLVHVQELIQWYLDDIGVATFWILPDRWYQFDYTHKIATDSRLFLPTRLPTMVASRNPNTDYKLWVINGLHTDLPPHLVKKDYDSKLLELCRESHETLDLYGFKEWTWDEDTRVHTENWESSDDEGSSEEEEE